MDDDTYRGVGIHNVIADLEHLRRHVIAALTMAFAIVCLLPYHGGVAVAASCQEPMTGTARTPILSPPLGKVVTGTGPLQFYSAPDLACPIKGVFVIPGDSLVAYAETNDGWSSVMYFSGSMPSGWVRSARLKTTGTMGLTQ